MKAVSVWINEDNHLCFFAGDDTLCISNWEKLRQLLNGREYIEDYLDEPSELRGEFANTAEDEEAE